MPIPVIKPDAITANTKTAFAGVLVGDGSFVSVASLVGLTFDAPSKTLTVTGGGGSSPSFLHTQSSPATTWTVNHNLGLRPAVEVRTVGGMVVIAEVQHTSVNQCVIYLAAAMAGSAFCTL